MECRWFRREGIILVGEAGTRARSVREVLTEVSEDICDNYCKFRHTGDEEYLCDVIREGKDCPLDRLN